MTETASQIVYMPTDPPRPAPFVLNAEEAACFLRIKGPGFRKTLEYYRGRGQLVGRKCGAEMVYLLPDLIAFIQSQ